jgi:hypothetical protein
MVQVSLEVVCNRPGYPARARAERRGNAADIAVEGTT